MSRGHYAADKSTKMRLPADARLSRHHAEHDSSPQNRDDDTQHDAAYASSEPPGEHQESEVAEDPFREIRMSVDTWLVLNVSSGESSERTLAHFFRFDGTVARRCVRSEARDQPVRGSGDFFHREIECGFVRFRGFRGSTQLPHKLQRGGANFIVCSWRIEIGERLDVSAHVGILKPWRVMLENWLPHLAGSTVAH